MHAAFLAAELEIRDVIVPPFPGVFSAWGMLEAELRKDASRAYYTPLAALRHEELGALLAELEAEGLEALESEGVPAEARRVRHAIDIRYAGQEYSLTIPLESAGEPLGEDFGTVLSARFDAAHETRFGHANPGAPIELVTVRSTALGDLGRAEPQSSQNGAASVVPDATRPVIFGRAEHAARALRREDLHAGAVVEGPAIVEEDTATTVVPPGATLRVVEHGALLIQLDTEVSR
jgi:N-methylhydantoinase A